MGTANLTRCTLHLRAPLAQKGILDSSCNPPSPSPSPSPDIDTSSRSSTTNNPSLASDCSAVKPRNLDQCCAVSAVGGDGAGLASAGVLQALQRNMLVVSLPIS